MRPGLTGQCFHFHVPEHRENSVFFAEEFVTELTSFCPGIGTDLQVFDANGDGYDDLTCHTPGGTIYISESHIVAHFTGENPGEQIGERYPTATYYSCRWLKGFSL